MAVFEGENSHLIYPRVTCYYSYVASTMILLEFETHLDRMIGIVVSVICEKDIVLAIFAISFHGF